jgi:hypothetical protein
MPEFVSVICGLACSNRKLQDIAVRRWFFNFTERCGARGQRGSPQDGNRQNQASHNRLSARSALKILGGQNGFSAGRSIARCWFGDAFLVSLLVKNNFNLVSR